MTLKDTTIFILRPWRRADGERPRRAARLAKKVDVDPFADCSVAFSCPGLSAGKLDRSYSPELSSDYGILNRLLFVPARPTRKRGAVSAMGGATRFAGSQRKSRLSIPIFQVRNVISSHDHFEMGTFTMHISKALKIALPIALATAPNASSAAVFVYNGTLSGANSVPANASTATGTYTVTVDDVADTVSVVLSFSGLVGGPASAAHIHCCVASNANGPVVIPFTGFPAATSGTYSNVFTGVSAANISGIENGFAYINIHDAIYPGGEIRGQILAVGQTSAVPEPATWAMMLGGFGLIGGSIRRRRAAKFSPA